MNILLPRLFTAVALLFACTAIAHAMPSVSGNTLSWPDDGWHQVQRADNFETVCEGVVSGQSGVSGGPCVVSPGTYIVINHSSGERFENINVTDLTPSVTGVSVAGNRIIWPADGWYQVQDATSYATLCEGGSSCTVEPGNYVVINHTTGARFNDIAVVSSNGAVSDLNNSNGSRPVSVVVSGNTIRWPDNGWYQVQNLSDYSTICEGGAECDVTDGNYVVINHQTGERTELAVPVGASGTETADGVLVLSDFDITVPVYVSNELKVEVTWGDLRFDAVWNADENWSALSEFPANTDNLLTVNFYDRNGGITLASYEAMHGTGSTDEYTTIAADQFDSGRYDDDGDGVSNLDELRAGSNPLDASSSPASTVSNGLDAPAIAFDLIDASQGVKQALAGFQLNRLRFVAEDLWYSVAQQTAFQWPDDSYYQMQHDHRERFYSQYTTYSEAVCEGGSECLVLPGIYTLINHTTGERSELRFPYLETESLPQATQLPDGSGRVPVERTQYNCAHGGSVIREFSDDQAPQQQTLLIDAAEHALVSVRERETTNFLFDQCRMTSVNGILPDGTYLVDGTLRVGWTYHNSANYTGYRTNSSYWSFDGFSIVGDDGFEVRMTGETERYGHILETTSHSVRNTVITDYVKKSPDGQIVDSIADGRYEYGRRWDTYSRYYVLSEAYSGRVRTPQTGNQQVSVSSNPALSERFNYDGYQGSEPEISLSGTHVMSADDGSILFMRSNSNFDRTNVGVQSVDYELLTATGEQILREEQPFYSPTTAWPVCAEASGNFSPLPVRSSTTRRLYCSRGREFLEL